MQRTDPARETQEQITREILIVRVVLDDNSGVRHFTDFPLRNISLNDPFERMHRHFNVALTKIRFYLRQRLHSDRIIGNVFMCQRYIGGGG